MAYDIGEGGVYDPDAHSTTTARPCPPGYRRNPRRVGSPCVKDEQVVTRGGPTQRPQTTPQPRAKPKPKTKPKPTPRRSECTGEQLRKNGEDAANCIRNGWEWRPTSRCTGVCVGERDRNPIPAADEYAGYDAPPAHQQPAKERIRDRGGSSRQRGGGGSSGGQQQQARTPAQPPMPQTPATAAPAPPELPRTSLADLMMRTPEGGTQPQAPGPQVRTDPVAAADPDPFVRRSLADLLADPRFLQTAASDARSARAIGEASGVRGAPVISATETGRRNLLNTLAQQAHQEDLASYGAYLAQNRDVYGRAADDWARANQAAQQEAQLGLAQGGQELQRFGLEAARDQDLWQRSWLPQQQQNQLDWQRQQQANQLGYNRWAVGQGNAVGIFQSLLNSQLWGQPTTPTAPSRW